MLKIIFICHGNICRSPMAEFVMKDLVEKQGLASDFYIASSATSTEEIWNGIGNPVYPPAKAELAKHGISCDGKRAVQLKKDDYGKYDLFIGMDSANIRNMMRIFGSDPKGKVHKLLEYTGSCADIADPWYSGDFTTTYKDIVAGCEAFLDFCINER
ncbi:MAG: low molecular weight protein-tyrosine-phosphatase [Acutalibacteraceae bacterium]